MFNKKLKALEERMRQMEDGFRRNVALLEEGAKDGPTEVTGKMREWLPLVGEVTRDVRRPSIDILKERVSRLEKVNALLLARMGLEVRDTEAIPAGIELKEVKQNANSKG